MQMKKTHDWMTVPNLIVTSWKLNVTGHVTDYVTDHVIDHVTDHAIDHMNSHCVTSQIYSFYFKCIPQK